MNSQNDMTIHVMAVCGMLLLCGVIFTLAFLGDPTQPELRGNDESVVAMIVGLVIFLVFLFAGLQTFFGSGFGEGACSYFAGLIVAGLLVFFMCGIYTVITFGLPK